MSRKFAHIADAGAGEAALLAGKKVKMLCGKKRYPLRDSAKALPMCSTCATLAMEMISRGDALWSGS